MDWEVLIPILMFVIPLALSFYDRRAKKRKGVPPVQARPVFPSDPEESEESADPAEPAAEYADAQESAPAPARVSPVQASAPQPRQQEAPANGFPLPSGAAPEGVRAIDKRGKKVEIPEEKPRLEIDKKKLILYSEILKPKFDS